MDKITPLQLLFSALTVCASVITYLVFYIKDMYKKNEERTASLNKSHEETLSDLYKQNEERLSELYKENLKMTGEMINAVNRNTDATERNNVTVNDLHKFILSENKK